MSEQKTTKTEATAANSEKPKAHAEGFHSHNDDMPNSCLLYTSDAADE